MPNAGRSQIVLPASKPIRDLHQDKSPSEPSCGRLLLRHCAGDPRRQPRFRPAWRFWRSAGRKDQYSLLPGALSLEWSFSGGREHRASYVAVERRHSSSHARRDQRSYPFSRKLPRSLHSDQRPFSPRGSRGCQSPWVVLSRVYPDDHSSGTGRMARRRRLLQAGRVESADDVSLGIEADKPRTSRQRLIQTVKRSRSAGRPATSASTFSAKTAAA